MQKRFLPALLALGALSACATPPPPPPPPPIFSGPQTFSLIALNGAAPAYAGVTLTLDGPRATGSTGCNSYMAVVNRQNDQPVRWFQVGEVTCGDQQMALERAYLQALDAASAVEESAAGLVLRDAVGGEVARFDRVGQANGG
ncbi:MAG: META domain-containing protein [Alphaproteobacteria bacterium]|nr:META domain-containing protein [Alphaproteobacteria bacterium]